MNAMCRRRFLQSVSCATALAALGHAPFASAQAMPDTLKLLCGYPAGGSSDIVTRRVGDKLAGSLAKTVIVDNRTGAAGRIAVDTLKVSAVDGSVMLLTPASVVTMYPYIYKDLSYHPLIDLAPVSLAAEFAHGLAVGPMVPASIRSLSDFIGWCRANPKLASCGNPGAGSMPHFLAMLLEKEAGVDIKHIPYRGTSQALLDLVAGRLPATLGTEGTFLTYVKDGRLRVLATSGVTRSQFLPDVPTFTEQGIKSIVVREWFGFFMPGKTPREVLDRAAGAVRSAVAQKDVIEACAGFGMVAVASTPAELERKVKAEYEYWGPVIKPTGFTAES